LGFFAEKYAIGMTNMERPKVQTKENNRVSFLPFNPKYPNESSGKRQSIVSKGKIPIQRKPMYLVKKMCFLQARSWAYFLKNQALIAVDLDRNQNVEKPISAQKIAVIALAALESK
jgi:hypothetical protein